MTIELEPGLADRVTRAAEEQGMDPKMYILRVVEENVPPREPEYGYLQRTLSSEEWIRETDAWIDSHKGWPTLPDEALQREDWYGERG